MPRELTSHKVNTLNECIVVEALDAPGSGGANHEYQISGMKGIPIPTINIRFQNGPIREAGANGITNEALLAIIIDRMEGFQTGLYHSTMNQIALDSLRTAQRALKYRTEERLARGVEGTHAV